MSDQTSQTLPPEPEADHPSPVLEEANDPNPPPLDERVVTFTKQWGSYFAGEAAAFMSIDAAALIDLGVATDGGSPDHPPGPPLEFHMALAGIDNPPRYWPPNPQHPEIVQTFDPSPLRQLQRAARDLESGKPGLAAREDLERAEEVALERAKSDPNVGAGPQPQPQPHPHPQHQPEPQVEDANV